MEKYYAKKSSAETIESRVEQKRSRIEFDMRDIVADPGDRKPIDDFHHDIRDEARRAYLQIGPYRPAGHKFPKTKKDGKGQSRGFVGSWFDQFDWLEYSVAKDAAYCFYCYLFKPQQAGFHSNDTFTKVGFRNWKNAKDSFKEHAQSIDGFHSNARKRALDFKIRAKVLNMCGLLQV